MKYIAVVLSGGKSRRMGRDKAKLDFGGKPLLTHLVDTYHPYFDEIYVSVNEAGRFDTAGAGEIVDHRHGVGPLAALESIFLDTDADVAFLTATDLPFGEAAAARALAEGCVGHDACLLSEDEPLFAAYSRSCLPAVTRSLDEDNRRLRRLLKNLDCHVLPYDPARAERILMNVNDPEQYRLALTLMKGDTQE